ncbi:MULTISPECIES: lambda exonuclease family protein [unclassified Acinetobacter]|uniref:lambda exonuclease family protein n=1 Tax=unclassified Acinetobacter TaxID=196816 RepID=UPI001F4A6053|nr:MULTISPECIES: lambda exonuclease family protein [unclassified Acinetobacter]MCH7353315.1 YqaJ viral recombinase family protein [Acinetobacter sp. NIPH 2023]MCH7360697.1 YqaJ viral recombinase family protein [Acinetobacter sp. NIPH 2024]
MNILQRSEDWHSDRCGKVTASRVRDLNAKPAKGKALNALGLIILAERLTGVQKEIFTNTAMQWGIDNEPNAITAYENETGSFVVGTGLINHPFIEMFGASPDGLVGEDGQIEVKCPDTTTHLNTLLTKKVPDEHIPQITSQLSCTRREWCDFISFDPRFEPELQIIIIRIFAKDLAIEALEQDVRKFNKAIDDAIETLKVAA